MMDSASSSSAASTPAMTSSTDFWMSSERPIDARTLSSLSNSLTAYQRRCASGMSARARASIFVRAASTSEEKVCAFGIMFAFATLMAASAASMTAVPFSAEISTTGTLRSLASFRMSILSPFFSTMSIMLMATTVGIPSSRTWVVR